MKKSVMYSETRTWFFELDMAEGADLDEVMSLFKRTLFTEVKTKRTKEEQKKYF